MLEFSRQGILGDGLRHDLIKGCFSASGWLAGRFMRFGLLAKLARGQVPRRQGRRHSAFPHARPRSRLPAYPFDEHAAREWVRR